jgi:hypothetical protein
MTWAATLSGVVDVASIQISGCSGRSYGESMPVKFFSSTTSRMIWMLSASSYWRCVSGMSSPRLILQVKGSLGLVPSADTFPARYGIRSREASGLRGRCTGR